MLENRLYSIFYKEVKLYLISKLFKTNCIKNVYVSRCFSATNEYKCKKIKLKKEASIVAGEKDSQTRGSKVLWNRTLWKAGGYSDGRGQRK